MNSNRPSDIIKFYIIKTLNRGNILIKDHQCGEISEKHIGKTITVAGWVHRRRDHGGLIFIDLRDCSGIVQTVFNPQDGTEVHKIAENLRNEFVIKLTGTVAQRPFGTENSSMPTGKVEVNVESVQILNESKTPPFYINEDLDIDETLRLKYRYLDIRRTRMKDNLILRHKVIRFMRRYLDARGFIEIETPILLKSTPEGARDYLVPSRLYPGKFYSLAQSPQQMKQLLMVAGIEKYYQIAKCFRDEDLRADRQPEFTQLDIEMSFINEEDMMELLEGLFTSLIESVTPDKKLVKPFPRFSYDEITERFGSDKPDLRYSMELADLTDIAADTAFGVFSNTVKNGGVIKAISAPGCGNYSKKHIEGIIDRAKQLGAAGLVPVSLGTEAGGISEIQMENVRSIAAKYLTIEQVKSMAERCGATRGDLLLCVAGKREKVNYVLGNLRSELGSQLKLADENELLFAFVKDFPLFTWDNEEERWQSTHHPFTAPQEQDMSLLDTEPGKVHGRHYDLILNGYEIAGGSIRIHQPQLQRRIFQLLGHSEEKLQALFGQLLNAFEYGAPPHGGVAPGIDRVVAILAGEPTIREVIAFPKNQAGMDPMFGSPSEVTDEQLDQVHISLKIQ